MTGRQIAASACHRASQSSGAGASLTLVGLSVPRWPACVRSLSGSSTWSFIAYSLWSLRLLATLAATGVWASLSMTDTAILLLVGRCHASGFARALRG